MDRDGTEVRISLARLEERIAQLDRLMRAEFVTHRALLDSQAEKVALALSASDKAGDKADAATEKRFESVNEFRAQLDDQAKTFISRVEFTGLRDSMSDKVDELRRHAAEAAGKGQGLQAGWGFLIGGVGLIGAVVSLGLAFTR